MGGHLDDAECLDELGIVAEVVVADVEILYAPECLDSEKCFGRNFLVSQQVVFCTGLARCRKFEFGHCNKEYEFLVFL